MNVLFIASPFNTSTPRSSSYLGARHNQISTAGGYADDDAWQKKEILARLRAFNTFGMQVKLYGNACQYFFKAWAQMAISIISPYLDEGQKALLLCLSKVLHELFLKISF